MDRFRRQSSQAARSSSRSKVTTIIDQSPDIKLSSNDRLHRGNHHAVKQKFQKSESDSTSQASCRTTLEHRLAFKLDRGSSVLPAGNLMKSLLADEMCKETESNRQTPNIIAKLMGLDTIPPQQVRSKQSKIPDRLNRKTVPSGPSRHRQSCNKQSCRKIASQQQFKDIYEVRESLETQTEGYIFQVSPNRKHKESEMAFIRQKFTEAKRLSLDKKLQGSKEFQDTIDALNSNNHLFLKFLQESDSMYAKHLHDLRASLQSRRHNVQKSKVPNVLDYNVSAIGRPAGRGASQKIDISNKHTQLSDKSVTILSKGEEATSAAPTKIILLKPNLGRSQKTAKSFSSSSSSHEFLSDAEMCKKKQTDARHGETERWGKKRLPIELEFSAYKCQESRVLAKEITRQMKSKLGDVSSTVPLSRYRGYSADESSQDMSGNDSYNETDTTFLASQTRDRSSFQRRSSSSRCAESSVNREGKKRLSERWMMTHKSSDIRMDKGTTLGEMLSMPDMDNSSPSLDGDSAENGSSGRLDRNVRLAGPVKPLGISSKEGWKDGCRSLLRSTSLPSTCDLNKNPESHIKHEVLGTAQLLVPRKGAGHGRKKAINGDLSWAERSSSGNRRLRDKKRCSSRHRSEKMVYDEQVEQVGGCGTKGVLEEKYIPELETVILEIPNCLDDTNLNLDSETEVEHENVPASLNSHNEAQVKDHSNCSDIRESVSQESSRTTETDGLRACLQTPVIQLESPVSSKETDQPSSISVLEDPFSNDVSLGSAYFERVSTELHGLRKQLQLLKLESKASDHVEATSLITSDDDEGESPAKNPTVTESAAWEASYTEDVLAELGLEETDPNVLMTSHHASDYPVGPWIFEKLEKKYNDQGTGSSSRPDRRLVFDRIKCGLKATAQRSMNLHPWVKTRARIPTGIRLTTMEEVLQSESLWMDVGLYIDGIGRELGKMVLDELVVESLVM